MIMVLKHGKMVEPCREANAANGFLRFTFKNTIHIYL